MNNPLRSATLSRFLVSGLLLALSLACSNSQIQTNSETKIIGGRSVAAGQWSSVVAMTERKGLPFGLPPLTPEQFEMIKSELLPKIKCTGTALTPRVIVTAAHCLVSLTELPDGPSSLAIHVGNGVEGGKFNVDISDNARPEDTGLLEIQSSGVHPLYGAKDQLGYDIAYIVLKKPLTLPASAYIPVLADAEEKALLLTAGRTVTAVGFGARSPGNGDKVPFGVKYEADLTLFDAISEIDDIDETGRSTHIAWDPKSEIVVKDIEKGSCRGDSGGPLFGQLPNGDWRLFGIVSRAYLNGTCASYATIFGLLTESICWVQSASHEGLGLPEGACDPRVK